MAANYNYTSWVYEHQKYGVASNSFDWTKVYYKMAITVQVWPDGTVKYSITSSNNAKAAGYAYDRCSVSLWIAINGETVVPEKYFTSTSSEEFPRNQGSTKTGTLSSKATGDSVTIESKILPASNYTGHTAEWNSSLYSKSILYREPAPESWTSAGGAVVNSITDNGDNTLTIVTTMGADGDNNSVSNVHIYGLVNSTEEVTTTNYHFAFGNGVINGKQVTFVIPAPSYEDEYYVRVRAYSISQVGDNPGGTTVPSGPCHYYHNVVKVKINNIWRNGIVWVKADGIWKKASKVYAKVGNTWKLSDTV